MMFRLAGVAISLSAALFANDVVYLHGRVTLTNGGPPGRASVIQVQCRGAEAVKQTVAGKDGKFNWKVERDDFDHIARSLPATATDIDNGGVLNGACQLRALLKGYDSSGIDLRDFIIGKDLKLPDLVLKQSGGTSK
jgi:hypothetical protein